MLSAIATDCEAQSTSKQKRPIIAKQAPKKSAETVLSVSDQALHEACEVLLTKSGFSALLRVTPDSIGKVARLMPNGRSVLDGEAELDEQTQLLVDIPNVGFFGKGSGDKGSACFVVNAQAVRARLNARDTIVLSYAAEELTKRGVKPTDIESALLPEEPFSSWDNQPWYRSKVTTVYFLEQKEGGYTVNAENRNTGKIVVSVTVKFRPKEEEPKQ